MEKAEKFIQQIIHLPKNIFGEYKQKFQEIIERDIVGPEEYNFIFFDEFEKYKNMRKNNRGDNNYSCWKRSVQEKYQNYSKEKIESFLFYLRCQEKLLLNEKIIDKKVFKFTIGTLIGGLSLNKICKQLEHIHLIDILEVIRNFSFLIVLIGAILLGVLATVNIMHLYKNRRMQREFLDEMKRIIEKM